DEKKYYEALREYLSHLLAFGGVNWAMQYALNGEGYARTFALFHKLALIVGNDTFRDHYGLSSPPLTKALTYPQVPIAVVFSQEIDRLLKGDAPQPELASYLWGLLPYIVGVLNLSHDYAQNRATALTYPQNALYPPEAGVKG
ncbi:MAG: hypothetical protein GXN92_01555, partial [Candidatus Micrarchaeota archaeon]|nr:hypothetical protein [Candidatus Micrarchaeota archaeon]